jgi:hypothetical protein
MCSLIHHGNLLKIWHATSRVVYIQLQQLRWLCLFILSALSSIPLLVNGNLTKNSLLGHRLLLASRLLTRLRKKLLRVLRGPFNFGWSTLIVIFTTQL